MKPKGIEAENRVSGGIRNLGNRAIIITQLSPAGGLGIDEKFVDAKLFDILIRVNKILIVPEKRTKEWREIEQETNSYNY